EVGNRKTGHRAIWPREVGDQARSSSQGPGRVRALAHPAKARRRSRANDRYGGRSGWGDGKKKALECNAELLTPCGVGEGRWARGLIAMIFVQRGSCVNLLAPALCRG